MIHPIGLSVDSLANAKAGATKQNQVVKTSDALFSILNRRRSFEQTLILVFRQWPQSSMLPVHIYSTFNTEMKITLPLRIAS
jgi:hypothetical protein